MKLFYYSHLGEEKGEADSKLPPGESAPSYICNNKSEGDEESTGANTCIVAGKVYKNHDTWYFKTPCFFQVVVGTKLDLGRVELSHEQLEATVSLT